ncbi:MAG: hypothetical protein WD670_04645 [Actinomycetota bacterium]
MTERWQEELRKLREVRPTADLDARIAEGPHPDMPPPAGRRVVAAVTAFALFAAAGAFAFSVLRDDGSNGAVVGGGEDPRLVLALVSTNLAPTATLHYGDQTVDVVTEGYEWCEVESDQCAGMVSDFAFYPPVSEYLVVPPGTPIEVTGDGAVGDFRVTDPDDNRVSGATELAVPDMNGLFAFQVTGEFERGQGTFFFGVQSLDGPASAPDVLSIDCSTGMTRTDTAIVRTQADGLHVVATGTEGFDEFGVFEPEGTGFFGVGGEFPQDGSQGWPVDPGQWEIGCFRSEGPVGTGDQTVAFELVDPDDHWAPTQLTCPEGLVEAVETTTTIPSSVPHEEAAAQLLDGLAEGDRIRGAGYDPEQWLRGPIDVVERDGRAVARLVLSPHETYGAEFAACADSGITLRVDVGQAVPDVLVLRCEGLGPAIDTPTVRLQPDGLHIEASNIADATVVDVRAEGSDTPTLTPFLSVTERFVVDVGPGVVSIGCLVQDEGGNVVGGPDEFPLAYLEVTVLPVE